MLLKNSSYQFSYFNTFHMGLRFFYWLLFKWRHTDVFPYDLYRSQEILYLVSTSVHLKELSYWSPQLEKLQIRSFLKFREILNIKFKTMMSFLSKLSPSLNPIQSSFEAFTWGYSLHSYLFFKSDLMKLKSISGVLGFGCFELGTIGLAVSDFCREHKLQSHFIQHGLVDEFLIPIPFNSYRIWNEWDRSFFGIPQGTPYKLKYDFSKSPTMKLTNNKKFAFFVLDYPSSYLSSEFINKKLKQVKTIITEAGWNLIIRPHPRDNLYWLDSEFKICLDPYKNLPVIESFEKNNASLFITFNSAAILEFRNKGILCLYLENPLSKFILAPLDKVAIKISDPKEIATVVTNY